MFIWFRPLTPGSLRVTEQTILERVRSHVTRAGPVLGGQNREDETKKWGRNVLRTSFPDRMIQSQDRLQPGDYTDRACTENGECSRRGFGCPGCNSARSPTAVVTSCVTRILSPCCTPYLRLQVKPYLCRSILK